MTTIPSASPTEVLNRSHGMTSRVTAYLPGGGIAPVTGLVGGSVTYNASQNVRRTASLTFAPLEELWPYSNVAALSVLGTELFIEYGIVVPGAGTTWVPLMRGPIQTVSRTVPAGSNGIAVTVSDRTQGISDDRINGSRKVAAGMTVVAAATQLIQETFPGAAVTDLTGSTATTPAPIDVQQDRLGSVATILLSIGAVLYTDRSGGFVFAPQATIYDPPKWTVTNGVGGTLIQSQESQDRNTVYNAVTASGQTSNNTTPPTATVYDTDGASPTYFGGPFGKATRFYVNPLLADIDQCTLAAQAILEQARGNQTKLSITIVPNPYMDVDEVVTATYRGQIYQNVADQIQIPLTAKDSMTIATRGVMLPSETQSIYDTTTTAVTTPAADTPTQTTA